MSLRIPRHLAASMVCCVWLVSVTPCAASPPQVQSVFPLGVPRGVEVELALTLAAPLADADRDEVQHSLRLWSPQVSLDASPIANSNGERWTCRVDAPESLDFFDLYLIGPTGISHPVRLAISDLPEVLEDPSPPGNDSPELAQPISLPSVVNGTIDPGTDRDWYRLQLDEGQSVHLRFQSTTLGSSVEGAVTLIDPLGREFLHDDGRSSEPLLSFVAPMAGDYSIGIHERAYRKGTAPTYRLWVVDQPLLVTHFTDTDVTLESEPANDHPETAPQVELPANIHGQFQHVRDQDWYRFEARKGEELWFEAIGERLGQEMDLELGIHDASGKLLQTLSDTAAIAKRSDPWAAATLDPSGSWKAPDDGEYRLIVRDLYGASLAGPHRQYRLLIRQSPPDPIVLVTDPVHLVPGQDAILTVIRHGPLSEGEMLRVRAINLPLGVSASEVSLDGEAVTGLLTFSSEPSCPPWTGMISLEAEIIRNGDDGAPQPVATRCITPLDRNPLTSGIRGPLLVIPEILPEPDGSP